jgi:membrane protein YqaA with SNARE-associated domain
MYSSYYYFLPQLKDLEQAKSILLITVISFLSSVIFTVFSNDLLLTNIEDLLKI